MKQMFHECSPSLGVGGHALNSFVFVSAVTTIREVNCPAGHQYRGRLGKPNPNHLYLENLELRTFNFQPVCLWTQTHGKHTEKAHETRRKITKTHGNTHILFSGRLCIAFPLFPFPHSTIENPVVRHC